MKHTEAVKHIFLVLAGLIVLFWTFYLMVNPLKFVLGPVLFLITVVAGEIWFRDEGGQLDRGGFRKFSGLAYRISGELVIVAVFVVCLIAVVFVPAVKGEIFAEWSALELPTATRLIAAFCLNFLPGYLILAILGKHEIGKLPKLIVSYFLSLFALTITGFVCARVVGIVDEFFLTAFILVCVALIAIYLFKRLLHKKPLLENPAQLVPHSMESRKTLAYLLVGLAVVFVSLWLLWMYAGIGFFLGSSGSDMWRHHSAAQTFLDYQAFRWLHAPWWFGLYLACFVVVSGAPSVNAYVALYPLIVLPVLSFYVMASSLLKDTKMASLATLGYSIFSGPAWLYALYLRNFGTTVSYDTWISILYQTHDKFLLQGRYPPFLSGFTASCVAYASLWLMLYATWQLNLRHRFDFFLLSTTIALSYLLHGIDPIIFLILLGVLLLVFLFTQSNTGKKQVRLAAVSVIVALVLVSLIDLSLTPQYDYFNSISLYALDTRYYYFNSPSFYGLAFFSVLFVTLTYSGIILGKLMRFYNRICERLSPKYAGSVRRHLVEILFCLYGVSLIVFLVSFPSLTVATMGTGWIPWYVYPVIGGIPFLFGFAGVAIVLLKWNELEKTIRDVLVFCALSVVVLFIFGQVISFVNEKFFFTLFWERRVLTYISPMMSVLMAYAVVTFFGYVRIGKQLSPKYLAKIGTASLLIAFVILGSVSSTLIAGDFASRVFFSVSPTRDELEALRYLHYALPSGYKTAYLDRRTGAYYIRAFASDKWTEDAKLWIGGFYYSPRSVVSAIRSADIRFLYINHVRDSEELEKNLFIQQLINVLPIEFQNSEVTIYSIPSLHFPSPFSPLGVGSSEEREDMANEAYTLWFFTLMMSNSSYMVVDAQDPNALNFTETIILPYDPLPIQQQQLLDWVSKGGHLIVSNTNPYGLCAKLFGLLSKASLVSCDSTENWKVLAKRGEIFVETDLKIEGNASLRLRNNQSAWERWQYTPPTPWNISGHEYLGIWVYGTGGGPNWYLHLTDSNGSTSYYRYDLSIFDSQTRTYVPSFTGWKLHLIPIKEHYSSLDLSAIVKLEVNTGSQLPVNILIDEVFSLAEVSGQRRTVVTSGITGTESIELPEMEVKTLSFSEDARLVANYTDNGLPVAPFAIQKDYGNGKVTYLNANLLYQSIVEERSEFPFPHEILIKVLNIVGVEGL